MKIVFALGGAVLALASAPAAATGLIVNGDFESGYGTTIPGWQVLANSNAPFVPSSIQIYKGSDYDSCCSVVAAGSSAAALANQFAGFGAGNVANNARLYQSFVATAGTYTLTFDLGAIQGAQRMAVSLYDFASGTFVIGDFPTQSGGQNLDALFTRYSYSFYTAGGRMDLQFDNYLSNTTNIDAFLDNVLLNAVPEPASWAMMIGGFALAGAAMRRRTRIAFA